MIGTYRKLVERLALIGLLNPHKLVSLSFHLLAGFGYRFPVHPFHTLGSPDSCLLDLPVRRGGCDAAQVQALCAKGISGPENRSHVVHAADVVQDDDQRQLGLGLVRLIIEPVQLIQLQLAHRCFGLQSRHQ